MAEQEALNALPHEERWCAGTGAGDGKGKDVIWGTLTGDGCELGDSDASRCAETAVVKGDASACAAEPDPCSARSARTSSEGEAVRPPGLREGRGGMVAGSVVGDGRAVPLPAVLRERRKSGGVSAEAEMEGMEGATEKGEDLPGWRRVALVVSVLCLVVPAALLRWMDGALVALAAVRARVRGRWAGGRRDREMEGMAEVGRGAGRVAGMSRRREGERGGGGGVVPIRQPVTPLASVGMTMAPAGEGLRGHAQAHVGQMPNHTGYSHIVSDGDRGRARGCGAGSQGTRSVRNGPHRSDAPPTANASSATLASNSNSRGPLPTATQPPPIPSPSPSPSVSHTPSPPPCERPAPLSKQVAYWLDVLFSQYSWVKGAALLVATLLL